MCITVYDYIDDKIFCRVAYRTNVNRALYVKIIGRPKSANKIRTTKTDNTDKPITRCITLFTVPYRNGLVTEDSPVGRCS